MLYCAPRACSGHEKGENCPFLHHFFQTKTSDDVFPLLKRSLKTSEPVLQISQATVLNSNSNLYNRGTAGVGAR